MKAFITGISGQDGSFLAELLVSKGYEVHGMIRRISQPNFSNISAIINQVTLHTGDMQDSPSLFRIIKEVKPNEIYNLAAMSQVRDSYDNPEVTHDINAIGLLRILESVKTLGLARKTRIYQACSSEMFGRVQETPQTEKTPFYPRSPYGASKVAAYNLARLYREAYGLKVYCGILFNHESPRRGEAFLSRKVAKGVAEIARGLSKKITLGNLDAKRDWGYAKEYVQWIWEIIQHPNPDDFVIATGENHSVREFVTAAFLHVGISDWEKYVEIDKSLLRPAEVYELKGDYSKSKKLLGFEPKVTFKELVRIMVQAELDKISTVHNDERRILQSFPEAKLIEAHKDCELGNHYHKIRDEYFVLLDGDAQCVNGRSTSDMLIGEIIHIPHGKRHTFKLSKGTKLIGLSTHPYDPSDVYK